MVEKYFLSLTAGIGGYIEVDFFFCDDFCVFKKIDRFGRTTTLLLDPHSEQKISIAQLQIIYPQTILYYYTTYVQIGKVSIVICLYEVSRVRF